MPTRHNKIVSEDIPINKVNRTARRINIISKKLDSSSYLEIGVHRGNTFNSIDIINKTAVDPKFYFDTSIYETDDISFNAMTSDNFFKSLSHNKYFDIIFIDGLHTFEQTFRDICNSLIHAKKGTIILIDDVKPNDVYSSIPNQKEAYRFRKQVGKPGYQWHGDVFKVIFAIHDFYPSLNYRTIIGSGNPQTLLWHSNKGWREPRFNSLELISRLTYFDLLDNLDILKESSEEEAIKVCINELA